MTFADNATRDGVAKLLEDHNVQTRMLFSGNIIRHPCFNTIRGDETAYRVVGDLTNTDRIMACTLWVGVYPGMKKEMIDYTAKLIRSYFGK